MRDCYNCIDKIWNQFEYIKYTRYSFCEWVFLIKYLYLIKKLVDNYYDSVCNIWNQFGNVYKRYKVL